MAHFYFGADRQLPVAVISVVAAQPFILSGQLIGLAVTTKDRWPDLLKVPTVEESGFPTYEYSGWMGVLGRKGMPEAELANLERQLLAIGASDEVRSRLYKLQARYRSKRSKDVLTSRPR